MHGVDDRDQTLRDGIAPHNTAKDVDKNARHFWVAGDELKGLLDGLGCCTTTDIYD